MGSEELSLTWDDHHSTLVGVFEKLLESNTLVDCTIAAEGQYLKAHKVVLSACSPYFELLFTQENEKNPIVVLKDIKFQELKAMIDFVYRGQVKIPEDRLGDFVAAAESLQIKGLGVNHKGNDSKKKETEPPLARKRESRASPIPRKRIRSIFLNASEKNTSSLSPVTIINNESDCEILIQNDESVEMSSTLSSELTSKTNVTPSVTVHRVSVQEKTSSITAQSSTSYVQPVQPLLSTTQSESLFRNTEPVVKIEPEPITEIFLPETECMVEPKSEVCEEEDEEEAEEDESLLDSELGTANAKAGEVSGQQSMNQYPDFPTSLETADMRSNDSYLMVPMTGHSSTQVKRKRKSLSIAEKQKLIEEVKRGLKMKKDIAADFGIPTSTLSTILKNEDRVMRKTSDAANKKRKRESEFPDVEESLVNWIQQCKNNGVNFSRQILKQKSALFAQLLGHKDFRASNGWLENFKKRNRIVLMKTGWSKCNCE